jgi:hypothetical protein
VALFLTQPAWGWNYATHRVLAAIAYDRLLPAARTRVDALIKLHPDYEAWFVKDAPPDEAGRARAAFIAAATWPDQIRSDRRFYDDDVPEVHPTPALPGFPDMKRHRGWHFIDLPFSQDETPLEPAPEPNVATELKRLMATAGRPSSDAGQVYDLPWLIHLVGDVHAPLHCVSRFSADQPKGDAGGNLNIVLGGLTLHKVWDDAVGTDLSSDFVDQTARRIDQAYVGAADTALDPEGWAEESRVMAMTAVYRFDGGSGSRENPVRLPAGYAGEARKTAESQTAKAGLRLAAVLNQNFR